MRPTPNLRMVGKLGDRVYSYHNGVFVSRPYYIPVQPGTPAQVARWEKFAAGVVAWQALTPEEKKVWRHKADQFNYEGFNRFMHYYLLS